MPQQPTLPSPLLEARFPNPMITTVKTSSVVQGMPKYRSMLAGNPAYIPSSYESIATATGTGSSGTITFSSIPSTFKHLQIRCSFLVSAGCSIKLQVNGVGGTSYAWHSLNGNGTAVAANAAASVPFPYVAGIVNNASTTQPNVAIIDILDYTSTTKNKTIRTFNGFDANGSGEVNVLSGLFNNTNAITSVSISSESGTQNFTTSSTFALYGIKEF